MVTQINAEIKSKNSSHWIINPEKEYYTHDELIDAYLKGKEQQKNENQTILIEKLEKNIKKAQNTAEQIIEKINSLGFSSYKAYLRIKNIVKFDVIFDIPETDYLSDSFDDVYKLSQKMRTGINNDTFHLNFTFMPHSDYLNEKRLTSDGFIFIYEKRG